MIEEPKVDMDRVAAALGRLVLEGIDDCMAMEGIPGIKGSEYAVTFETKDGRTWQLTVGPVDDDDCD